MYPITIEDHLNRNWSHSLGDLVISNEFSETGSPLFVPTDLQVDRAALFGVLNKL